MVNAPRPFANAKVSSIGLLLQPLIPELQKNSAFSPPSVPNEKEHACRNMSMKLLWLENTAISKFLFISTMNIKYLVLSIISICFFKTTTKTVSFTIINKVEVEMCATVFYLLLRSTVLHVALLQMIYNME